MKSTLKNHSIEMKLEAYFGGEFKREKKGTCRCQNNGRVLSPSSRAISFRKDKQA